MLPSNNLVSNTIGTVVIVIGGHQPYFISKIIALGAYKIVYTKTQNYMTSRGIPAIKLRPLNDRCG